MKKKKMAAMAAAVLGAAVVFVSGGILAGKTVFAAEGAAAPAGGTVLQSVADAEVRAVYKKASYGDAGCTLTLPAGYVISGETPGLYLSERYPVDSSNIYYTVSENIDAEALEEAMEAEEYRRTAEAEFREAYGEEASIIGYHMEKTETDGCPSYKIELSCKAGDMQMDQLVYIIAADRVYTVTYSQSADDGRMEQFKKSAETIQLVFLEG